MQRAMAEAFLDVARAKCGVHRVQPATAGSGTQQATPQLTVQPPLANVVRLEDHLNQLSAIELPENSAAAEAVCYARYEAQFALGIRPPINQDLSKGQVTAFR